MQLLQALQVYGGNGARPRGCIELIEGRFEARSHRREKLDLYAFMDGVVTHDGHAGVMVQLREDGRGREA